MSNPLLTPVILALGACLAYPLVRVLLSPRDSLPPGPRRWPLIGNALQVPRTYAWLTFSKWAKTYGDIVYVDVVGQPMVILNSAKMARELLHQRSAIYSDRPILTMAKLSGYCEGFVLLPYGESWRQQRKIVAQDFSQLAIARYHSLQETEARKLVLSVLDDPRTLHRKIKLGMGTIIIRVTFGHYITGEQDPFLTAPLRVMENFSKATVPGVWLVDFFPLLRYLPRWTPGASFLRTAAKWRELVWNSTLDPYLWSKEHLETGDALLPNMCATVLEAAGREPTAEQEDRLIWASSTVMGGGLDTNTSSMLIFFLAMMLNPSIQAKARKEINDVIGAERLPTIEDKASLPYVRSIMMEVLRWHPALPLGLPHALSKDDIYEGMYLPKGSIMVPNVWYMLHDPEFFPSPDEFNPDRYNNLHSEMDKVADLVFGFGRRVCPGKLFAEATFFAISATVLATCEILPVVDAQGNKVVPDITFSSGTIVLPSNFDIDLKCRSSEALDLLTHGMTDEAK